MTVLRARTLGFCPGVKRALKIAESTAEMAKNKNKNCFVLGEIVHNPTVSEHMRAIGLATIDNIQEINCMPNSIVVIRSHGAAPSIINEIITAGAEISDATCPKVAANQKAAARYAANGYLVVIAGDKGHGETLGIAGHAEGSVIISSVDEASKIITDKQIALVAQTTISKFEYANIATALKKNNSVLELGGICSATQERRESLAELAKHVEAIVIVGGKNSANTKRLAELAIELGLPTWHIESSDELPPEIASYSVVGLSAGASTPELDIIAVESVLKAL